MNSENMFDASNIGSEFLGHDQDSTPFGSRGA
jgi:hypothetical protein